MIPKVSLALLAALFSSASIAAPVTFFGEDLNFSHDPNTAPFTNATAAKNNFFSNLTGVGTQTFESFAAGTPTPLVVNFGVAGAATINGGSIASGNDSSGRYPFSGTKYLNAGTNNFGLTFSTAISAFGFYGMDIGDFGGNITLTLTDSSNATSTLVVPNTVGSEGNTSGSNLYFGFYDLSKTYTSVAFGNNSGGQDVFAFDDFSIGSLQQVTPGAGSVPEPSTWAMMILGFAGVGFMTYRRSRKGTTALIAA